ncbi:anthranilate dioxygenase reductase [Pseudomonas mucidolens]|nr:anthranilate dioxygenase reductase [Pseudomonas mucidolens]
MGEAPAQGNFGDGARGAVRQLGNEVARHAPPRCRSAIHRAHHRVKAQRCINRPLQLVESIKNWLQDQALDGVQLYYEKFTESNI